MAKVTVTGNRELPFCWNVSAHVGHSSKCQNHTTDVELVKLLVAKALRHPVWGRVGSRVGNRNIPINGSYDTNLGFWLYAYQASQDPQPTVDGIVTPAPRHTLIYGAGAYLIVLLNLWAKDVDGNFWNTLATNPAVSAQLRQELMYNIEK